MKEKQRVATLETELEQKNRQLEQMAAFIEQQKAALGANTIKPMSADNGGPITGNIFDVPPPK